MAQTIDISDLPEPLAQAIETIVRTYRARNSQGEPIRRPMGWARGVLPELPQSFFDPLPDEVLDAFEGKNP